MRKAYRLLKDRELGGTVYGRAGDMVHALRGWDYGLAGDDTRLTGTLHVSVTHDPDGDYPFFTVPVSDLEETEAQPTKGN